MPPAKTKYSDRVLGLVLVDLHQPPVRRVGMHPEKVPRLAQRDAVADRFGDAVTQSWV